MTHIEGSILLHLELLLQGSLLSRENATKQWVITMEGEEFYL